MAPLLLDAHGRRQIRVFPKGQVHHSERADQSQYSHHLEPERELRPVKAYRVKRHHDQPDKGDRKQ
jgi:hypothetical protein